MKSTIFSLLPLAGLALAQSVCKQETKTHTEYETVYETAKAVTAKAKPTTCSRRTVTTTAYEKVYITVDASDIEDARTTTTTVDVTSTSTLHMTTTVHVHLSASATFDAGSSGGAYYPNVTSKSTESQYSPMYTLAPHSEAATSTAQAGNPNGASSISTSQYEAPAQSTSTPAPTQGTDTPSAGSVNGDATFYGGNVAGGMCSFTGYTIPSDLMGTALSDSNWAGAANCGACVQVTGPGGNKITAMVVDQCPGCGSNHLDLFPDAFSKLANPSTGVIPVSWDIVPCGITSPIVLKNKEGTSEYWFSMQVMNSNLPVSKLEVSTDGGASWASTTRKDYNYFENPSGFGTNSVDVKVTSTDGSSIIVNNVSVAAGSTITAESNFS